MNNGKNNLHIFYFDFLRAIAIIAVIIFHLYTACNSLVLNQYATIPSFDWIFTDIISADFRFGVDLFLMMSGALILGRETDLKSFLTKRIPRITIPFVFWLFVLSIVSVAISMIMPDIWQSVDSFNIMGYLKYLWECLLYDKSGFTHLWFFWMIFGIYLIMPVFNKWILHSDLKEIEYFLIIWFVTCIFDATLNHPLILDLTYFTGPIGMVVLGYYLRYTDRKIFNNPRLSIVILIFTAIIGLFVSYLKSDVTKMVYFANFSVINVFEVIAIFSLVKNFDKLNINMGFIQNPNNLLHKSIVSIAKYSYGIYLIHRLILAVLSKLLENQVPYISLLVILFILTLLISWGILLILNKVPYLNKIIN